MRARIAQERVLERVPTTCDADRVRAQIAQERVTAMAESGPLSLESQDRAVAIFSAAASCTGPRSGSTEAQILILPA